MLQIRSMACGQDGVLIVLVALHVVVGLKHGRGNAIHLHHQGEALIVLVDPQRQQHVMKRNAGVRLLTTYAQLHIIAYNCLINLTPKYMYFKF